MKYSLITVVAMLLVLPCVLYAQEPPDVDLGHGWKVGLLTSVPVAKIVESSNPGVKFDVVPVLGIAGGPCFFWGDSTKTDIKRVFSVAVPTVILTTRIDAAEMMDIAIGVVAGVFDDRLQFGVVYNAGKIETKRSRVEGILSLGIAFK